MNSVKRTAGITTLALGLGFVGGAWFVGSGAAFRFVGEPTLSEDDAKPIRRRMPPPAPHVKAVAVPPRVNYSGGSAGLGPRVERVDLLPSPGCTWAIEPRRFQMPCRWQSSDPDRTLAGYAAIDARNGAFRYLFIQSGQSQPLRPVFFDEAGNRYVAGSVGRGSGRAPGGVFLMNEFILGPVAKLAPAQVAYFGIERVVPDAAKQLVAAAQKEAKGKGMAILPPPELGQPYPLDLPTAGGEHLRSAELRGKAVLVAAWGPPSAGLALMTARKIRATSNKDELAIVNVSFDGSVQDARESLAKDGCDGPLVAVPNDPAARRIWCDGAGIDHLPAFFLIDREGVLRFTCGIFELPDRVDTLLGRPRKASVFGPARFQRPGAPQPKTARAPAECAIEPPPALSLPRPPHP